MDLKARISGRRVANPKGTSAASFPDSAINLKRVVMKTAFVRTLLVLGAVLQVEKGTWNVWGK